MMLRGPYDVIVGSDKSIWLTDPRFGRCQASASSARPLGSQSGCRSPSGQVGGEPQLVFDRR